ncbi:MAG: hypothetical protein J6T70_14610 [Bacteroidales bacterium]|nr:hypothetical protein [Bacteroidales bacterium]
MDVLYSFFSDSLPDFFDEDVAHTALKIFATMFLASVLVAVVYYKIIDSVAFNKKRHWFFTMILVFVISGIAGYLLVNSGVSNYLDGNPDSSIEVPSEDMWLTGLMNAFYSVIMYFVCSILIKGRSHNCPVTPF